MIKRIGIVGLGTVGEAVVQTLFKYRSLIERRTSINVQVKTLCDSREAKRAVAKRYGVGFSSDYKKLINDPDIDIIVELIGGIEPARTIHMQALGNGKSVVTANKALLAQHGKEIFALALKQGKSVGFEASVCGAIPLIKSVSEGLVSCEVKKIYGILNGTTNYVLYKMGKERLDFAAAVKEAQAKGFAERNPTFDIEGVDSLHKLSILSYLGFGIFPDLRKVHTEGISRITLEDILYARELGYRIKLLAIAKRHKDELDLRVHPTLIPVEHPLADVSLAYNAVYLETSPAGNLLFFGEGAGGVPTSSSVVSDIVSISRQEKSVVRQAEQVKLKNLQKVTSCYYMRFMTKDKPGVLAKIAEILSGYKISIASVSQKGQRQGNFVPIVIVTHQAQEDHARRAFERIDKLAAIKRPSQRIRIETL